MSDEDLLSLPLEAIAYQNLIELLTRMDPSEIKSRINTNKRTPDQPDISCANITSRFKSATYLLGDHAQGNTHVQIELDVQIARKVNGLAPLPNSYMNEVKFKPVCDSREHWLGIKDPEGKVKRWMEKHGVYTDVDSVRTIDLEKRARADAGLRRSGTAKVSKSSRYSAKR